MLGNINTMSAERKNINRGYKKLEVWQDAIELYHDLPRSAVIASGAKQSPSPDSYRDSVGLLRHPEAGFLAMTQCVSPKRNNRRWEYYSSIPTFQHSVFQ